MKIAQIAPLFESVPPKLYGGTERVVASLCDALVELGHEVTLFASAESRTRAPLIAGRKCAIRLDEAPLKSDLAAHLRFLNEVRHHAAQFDVLHFHLELLHLPLFELDCHKCVTTLHNRLDVADLRAAYDAWPGFGLVSISDHQRLPIPNANWLATVPHGLPARIYDFRAQPEGGYLAFLGRASPEKGLESAIRIAIQAGMPLKIAAKVDYADRIYFEAHIKPLLQEPSIEFIGEISDAQKSDFIGNARALLFPIRWPEPFGLVMIEAMACGTPVIAFERGAVPEVLENGVSGFIVKSEDEAVAALSRLHQLDRHRVRAAFERRFSAERMANDYASVYRRLLKTPRLECVS
ncbi:MAG: glycosyltransferase family 4 protein [Proteobacteria bacterium]|nr:glycosyltransferase family 4 protein [Pseudomonadota bacterium]